MQWQPLSVREAVDLFRDYDRPYWMAGGWAIDLFLDRQTRAHHDTDVLVLRDDQLVVQEYLADWDLWQTTPERAILPWAKGKFLTRESLVDEVLGRRTPESPWSLEIMFMDTAGEEWVWKRNPAVRGPLATMGRRTDSGIPYLAPEIQLFFKAQREPRDKDEQDFTRVLPLLATPARAWLTEALTLRYPDGHHWLERCRALL